MPDPHKNFAYSTVTTAPSPAGSGTSLVVAAGHGSRFPTPPFNATVWPAGAQPTVDNAEIVRVTAISTDTLTIVRAQEGSSARSIVSGDQIANTITGKTLTDVEAAVRVQANLVIENDPTTPNSIIDITADKVTIEDLLTENVSVEVNKGIEGVGGVDDFPAPDTDDFNRADSDTVGGSFTESENNTNTLKILSNQLKIHHQSVSPNQLNKGFARRSSTPADQFSQLVFKARSGADNNHCGGVGVRMSGSHTAFTGYIAVYGGSTPAVKLYEYNGAGLDAVGTELGTYTVTLVNGDVLKLDVQGSAIKVFINGIERISVTDATITTGDAGVVARNPAGSHDGGDYSTTWDDWSGGAAAATASKWFAIWLIAKIDGTVAGLMSESFTAPTMPSGYTKKRRIGAVRSNGSNNFYRCIQRGEFALYQEPTYNTSNHRVLSAGSATSFTAVSGTTRTVPPSSRRAFIRGEQAPTAALMRVFVRPTGSGLTAGRTIGLGDTSGDDVAWESWADLDASQLFDYRITSTGTVSIDIHGYIDPVA